MGGDGTWTFQPVPLIKKRYFPADFGNCHIIHHGGHMAHTHTPYSKPATFLRELWTSILSWSLFRARWCKELHTFAWKDLPVGRNKQQAPQQQQCTLSWFYAVQMSSLKRTADGSEFDVALSSKRGMSTAHETFFYIVKHGAKITITCAANGSCAGWVCWRRLIRSA